MAEHHLEALHALSMAKLAAPELRGVCEEKALAGLEHGREVSPESALNGLVGLALSPTRTEASRILTEKLAGRLQVEDMHLNAVIDAAWAISMLNPRRQSGSAQTLAHLVNKINTEGSFERIHNDIPMQ